MLFKKITKKLKTLVFEIFFKTYNFKYKSVRGTLETLNTPSMMGTTKNLYRLNFLHLLSQILFSLVIAAVVLCRMSAAQLLSLK